MKVPEVEIGVLSSDSVIHFHLNGVFVIPDSYEAYSGSCVVSIGEEKQLILSVGQKKIESVSPLLLKPVDEITASFDMDDVVIGVEFHWERRERQRFKGQLKLIVDGNKIVAINVLPIEEYLLSVISSEMKATSSIELLKAHAVISRSWVLAQKEKSLALKKEETSYRSIEETEDSYIRWYDREDHELFDVCADDHCQRYQGIARFTTLTVAKAVKETLGEVLMEGGKLCDARFSKCCGGITESFENVWEPFEHPYLKRVVDSDLDLEDFNVDLRNEVPAAKWITTSPPAFCNTKDKKVLSQVLNDYDQETADFYRWEVSYTQAELSWLITKKTGWDFGEILDLVPIERGVSGRIIKLQIIGTKKRLVIGKELFIRKALAESHLYSSAFIVEKKESSNGVPFSFVIKGAGWGHGVGLCQIGAAIMGEKGYSYTQILEHYFPGAKVYKSY